MLSVDFLRPELLKFFVKKKGGSHMRSLPFFDLKSESRVNLPDSESRASRSEDEVPGALPGA